MVFFVLNDSFQNWKKLDLQIGVIQFFYRSSRYLVESLLLPFSGILRFPTTLSLAGHSVLSAKPSNFLRLYFWTYRTQIVPWKTKICLSERWFSKYSGEFIQAIQVQVRNLDFFCSWMFQLQKVEGYLLYEIIVGWFVIKKPLNH